MGRVRPSGTANVPTDAEVGAAREAVAATIQDLTEAADRALLRLSRLTNPVERARAALEVRRWLVADLTGVTDDLFRDAVIEAYAAGRAGHGWYGYGALGEALGVTRARVHQIVTGAWKGPEHKEAARVAALRASADRARTARRLATAGWSVPQIAAELGIEAAEAADLTGLPAPTEPDPTAARTDRLD